MARTILPPYEYCKVQGVPVMVTVKNVKNFNLRIKDDKVNISVPHTASKKRTDEVIQNWLPRIEEVLDRNEELRKAEGPSFLCEINNHNFYSTFDTYGNQIEATPYGENILVHFPKEYLSTKSRDQLISLVKMQEESLLAEVDYQLYKFSDLRLKTVLMYGDNYSVVYLEKAKKIHRDSDKKILYFPSQFGDIRKQIEELNRYLSNELLEYSLECLEKWEPKLDKYCSSVLVKPYKSKWASINIKKHEMRLNFYLVCTPKLSIEGTIVHELCHLYHTGHQKDFYNTLNFYFPRYRESQSYLNKYRLPIIYYKLGFKSEH